MPEIIVREDPLPGRACRALAGLCLLGQVAGCAVSNEGAVDYRKATIMPGVGQIGNAMADITPGAGPTLAVVPAVAPAVAKGPIAPAHLLRQALPGPDPDARIEPNDSISIHLRAGYLKTFEAMIGHPMRGFRANGEIAIVVKAFEFGQGGDFNFGPDAVREGRLVYYSADVEKGQMLNFANLPVYGPITYRGNPIGIDISVLEIDADNAQITALLGTLAKVGAQAFPPAAPILPVLNALGGALLKGGTNDTEFRFTLMLDPAAGYAGTSHPTLEAADYVFVKKEDRTAETPWQDLVVDRNTGRVFQGDVPYVGDTYLTFQINKNLSSTDIDLSQNTFGRFLDELEQEDLRKADELKPFLVEVEKLGVARMQTRAFGEARDLLTTWQTAKQADPTDADGTAKRAAHKLVGMLKAAIGPNPEESPEGAELSSDQVDYLLGKLADMANASTELDRFTRAGFVEAAADFNALFAAVQGA